MIPVPIAILARVVRLLNDAPRFGPRNRRLRFDSYSVAADLSELLTRAGINPNLYDFPDENG